MEGVSQASAENQRRRQLSEAKSRESGFEAERSEHAMEEEKILKEIKQKIRENFYQITQYVLNEMDGGDILMDNLKRVVENSHRLGTFKRRCMRDTMPSYEGTEGYGVWNPGRFEGEEICISCQILDSGKLRIVGITEFH